MNKVVVTGGTYDGGIIGYVILDHNRIKPFFGFTAHLGCVRSVCSKGKLLASGSTDESIKIYDLNLLRETHSLLRTSGSVCKICILSDVTHLISSTTDGSINIWRCRGWELLKTLHGVKNKSNSCNYNENIIDIDVHDSGRMLISVSSDGRLRLWDLMKGLCCFNRFIQRAPVAVSWSPKGECYAVLYPKQVIIFHATSEKSSVIISQDGNFSSMVFISETRLIIGGSKGHLYGYELTITNDNDGENDDDANSKKDDDNNDDHISSEKSNGDGSSADSSTNADVNSENKENIKNEGNNSDEDDDKGRRMNDEAYSGDMLHQGMSVERAVEFKHEHEIRIKGIVVAEKVSEADSEFTSIVSADSDGKLFLWKLTESHWTEKLIVSHISSINTGCRIVSLTCNSG